MSRVLAGDEPRGGPAHSGGKDDTVLCLIQETHFITLGCLHWDTFSPWYIVHCFRNIQDSR